ncbi:MAG: FGGY family carbohydrate kinase [Rectinema sp.]
MTADCIIGVDIGTQGTKAALHSHGGECLAEAFEPSNLIRPGAGMVEEDPERQFASLLSVIRACMEKSGIERARVACVAIDGQMAGVIGVGGDGIAVTPYDSWLDTRCAPYIAQMRDQAGDAILKSTGNVPSFNHGPKILYWKAERPEIWKRVRAFVQPGGYAAMRLCGLSGDDAFIDDTYLHFSGFADNAAGRWNPDLCAEFGVPPSIFPRIVRPADIVGGVSAAHAAACGLAEGTPVAAGLGDTAASFLSCGAVAEGICVDVAGTASVFAATVGAFAPDTISGMMGCGRSAVPGLWHPYAYVNGGGMDLIWFSEQIAKMDFETLNALASDLPRLDDDPWFLPHMEGRVMPAEPGMRGAWAGLMRSHGLGHMYRAILESVALEYSLYLKAAAALHPGVAMEEVRATGGGSGNAAWNAIKADALGLPIRTMRGSGGAPTGAAMVAAAAAGLAENVADIACAWARIDEETFPSHENLEYYRRRSERYERLLNLLGDFPGAPEEQR